MRILISNDDGIQSPGIRQLAKSMSEIGEVTVVAPHRERSTASHSLTLHKPLRIHQVEENFYSTSGSPADCIYLGLNHILKSPPDIIVSGINAGANLGTDVHYSGTVAAAREAALMNIRSYAFSMVAIHQIVPDYPRKPYRFDLGANIAKKIVLQTKDLTFPDHTLINVNIPNHSSENIKGIKVARQGVRYYSGKVIQRIDHMGKDYYWIGGPYLGFERGKGCDCDQVDDGYVSVTPLTIDVTHNEFYATLKDSSLSLVE